MDISKLCCRAFIVLIITILVIKTCTAQKVYYASSQLTADISIYITKSKLDADAIIFFTEAEFLLNFSLTTWYITTYRVDSDFTIFITRYRQEADIIIYSASSALCTGWRNNEARVLIKRLIR